MDFKCFVLFKKGCYVVWDISVKYIVNVNNRKIKSSF